MYKTITTNACLIKDSKVKSREILIIQFENASTAHTEGAGGPTSLLSQIIVLPLTKRGRRYA